MKSGRESDIDIGFCEFRAESFAGNVPSRWGVFGLNPATDVVWELGQMRRNQFVLKGMVWENGFHFV